MYNLISAIGKPLSGGGRWSALAIGDLPLNTLFATYAKVYAILSNPFIDHQVALDLDAVRAKYGAQSITFNQMLVALGDAALPTSDTLPVLNTRYARYADAFRAGYKVQPIHPTASPDAQLPPADKTWLYLTRPDTDYDLFHRSCLLSVNGFFHQSDGDASGIYVKDGMVSCVKSRQNQLGIYSFREIGNLTQIPITADMVYKQNAAGLYRQQAYINLGQDVSNKHVMLVLGGYLHVLDKRTFYRVGPGEFCINMQNLPLFDRYYESRKYLDLSSLGLETTERNPWQIGVNDFLSDAVLLQYLTLSQSFFVIIGHADLFVERAKVHLSKMSNLYISYVEPWYPLITGAGKMSDYWAIKEDGQYSLSCQDAMRDNPLYYTVDPLKENSLADGRVPAQPFGNSSAFLLKIGCDL